MATLQRIRNRGTLLMLIIGLALFAFIIGDAVKNSSSYFGNSQNMIGEVDGEPISYTDYRKKVTENLQQAEVQRGRVSNQERDMIEAQTWNQMLETAILEKSQEELGIEVTTKELSHIFLKKTDNVVKQAFGDADETAIAQQIRTVENGNNTGAKAQFTAFKDYVKAKREKEKFYNLLSKGLSSNIALSRVENSEGKVNFQYIKKSYNTIPDSTISVSDSEIEKYYNEHIELFKQVPAREISFLKIDVTPSAEDFAFATKNMTEIKNKFAQTKDPIRFASVNSDLKLDTRFWKKEEITDTALSEFAFSGNDGVYGPFGQNNIKQIARVAIREMLPDSVKASHILLQGNTDIQKTADSIVSALKKGEDFATLAKKYSKDKDSATKGGELGWFGKGQMIPLFQNAAFKTAKGGITTVKTQFGLHIIKVLDKSKEHENVQLAVITKEITPSNKTYQMALTDARHIAENVKNLEDLSAIAQEKNMKVKDAIFYAGSTGVREVPNSKELVRIAFKAEQANTLLANKDNSTVFEFDECYIIAGLKTIKDGKYSNIETPETRNIIIANIRKEKKEKQLQESIQAQLQQNVNLADLATKEGVQVESIKNATFTSSYLPNLGLEPKVIATAVLQKENNGIYNKAIIGNEGVFVIGNIEVVDEDKNQSYEATNSFYNKSLERRALQQGYQALYENAEVTDERYRF